MRDEETNMLALVKGMERYVFLYTDDKAAEVLQQLGRFASNPELSFTWYDAVVVGDKVRKQAEEQRAKKCEADALKKKGGRPPR